MEIAPVAPVDLNSTFTSPLKRSRDNTPSTTTPSPTSQAEIKKIKIDAFFTNVASPVKVETNITTVPSPAPTTPITAVAVKPVEVKTKLQKQQEREEKRLQKEKEKKEKEEEKKRRDEEKKKKEEEKKKKEEERLAEKQRKEEEKKKKDEEKKKKEEERLAKQQAKEDDKKKKEEEKKKKEDEKKRLEENAKQKNLKAWGNFLKVQPKQEEESKPKEERIFSWLPPLTRDANTIYASVKRVESKSFEQIDQEIAQGGEHVEFLKQFKNRVAEKRRVVPVKKRTPNTETTECNRLKYFAFHDNLRPSFYGTFTKNSKAVRARRPFGKDELLDYEVDSDDEWEMGEGENIDKSDDEKEEVEKEEEDYEEDDFLVADGNVEESEDENGKSAKKDTPRKSGTKALLKLIPTAIGPIFDLSPESEDFTNLAKYRMQTFVATPIVVEEQENSEESSEAVSTPSKAKSLPDTELPALIKVVHGNSGSVPKIIEEFRKDHMHIPKAQIEKKIKEIAVKERRQGYYKAAYFVKSEVFKSIGIEEFAPLAPVAASPAPVITSPNMVVPRTIVAPSPNILTARVATPMVATPNVLVPRTAPTPTASGPNVLVARSVVVPTPTASMPNVLVPRSVVAPPSPNVLIAKPMTPTADKTAPMPAMSPVKLQFDSPTKAPPKEPLQGIPLAMISPNRFTIPVGPPSLHQIPINYLLPQQNKEVKKQDPTNSFM